MENEVIKTLIEARYKSKTRHPGHEYVSVQEIRAMLAYQDNPEYIQLREAKDADLKRWYEKAISKEESEIDKPGID